MAYQQLNAVPPISQLDRIANLEGSLLGEQAANRLGTIWWANNVTPGVAATGTDTAGISTVTWITRVRVDQNALLTGIAFLIGATGTTDLAIVALYDPAGTLVANSALAGVTVGSPGVMQAIPFTSTYPAKPGLYFIGVSTNGNHATIRTQAVGVGPTGQITGGTFGTLTALTPPTTFTANYGPVACTY